MIQRMPDEPIVIDFGVSLVEVEDARLRLLGFSGEQDLVAAQDFATVER